MKTWVWLWLVHGVGAYLQAHLPHGGVVRSRVRLGRGPVPLHAAPMKPERGLDVKKATKRVGAVVVTGSVAALTATQMLPPVQDVLATHAVRDAACALFSVGGAVAWLKIWTTLASNGAIDSRLSRKIIHCGSAPLFLLVWPFFSADPSARLVASIVPALNMLRLIAAGVTSARSSETRNPLVTAVSRSGDPSEVLKGPLIYCAVLLAATLFGWRGSPAAVVAVAQMAVGDGVADIVGRRFGKTGKWPFSPDKSYAGSLAFVVGASLASFGMLQWFTFMGCLQSLPVQGLALFGRIFLISLACALVELVSVLDDNISVPLVGGLLALAYLS